MDNCKLNFKIIKLNTLKIANQDIFTTIEKSIYKH